MGSYLGESGPEPRCEERMPGLVKDVRKADGRAPRCVRCHKRKPIVLKRRQLCADCRKALML